MPTVGDTVLIIYRGPQSKYKIGWDGREKELVKDLEAFMPFEMAANWFGDPRSGAAMISTTDHKRLRGWVPDRPTEVRRLRVVYGVQHGREDRVYLDESIPLPPDAQRAAHWQEIDNHIPRVEMYDLETRERLYTVLEDPAGDHVAAALITVSDDEKRDRRLAQLEEMVEDLTAQGRPDRGLFIPGPDGQGKAIASDPDFRTPQGTQPEPENDPNADLISSEKTGAAGLPADGG